MREVQVQSYNQTFKLDIAINRLEREGEETVYYEGNVAYLGDISVAHAYQSLPAQGYELVLGQVHPKVFETVMDAQQQQLSEYHREGYLIVKVSKLPPPGIFTRKCRFILC
ncbi:MAG: hypothetical protein HC892_05875 [Saprospiraceae bacterium]|nr:hypothetical protein [Saprospiraceae bacterium]